MGSFLQFFLYEYNKAILKRISFSACCLLKIPIDFSCPLFCGQLKLYVSDGKKYLSDVINENGVKLLLTIIPSKYKKAIQDGIQGMLDPIDGQSKKKAYQLYKTKLILDDEIGKRIFQKIHAFLFEGLYPFMASKTKAILLNL